ncbi:MAG TPA: cytochrome b N-terminal domain-containing protein [Vicinamibacterales bacterium]|nr:cytochrome b N-terminal domain-containing protein [Vicinamibacterales bacterium]
MAAVARASERLALRLLAAADALANRLYSQPLNPLYQSGTIVVALYLVLVVTGLWLTLFYRIGAPWESVSRVTADPWAGNWVRGLHRYASDLAVVATAVHALRMFAQGRSWGPRTLAWVSGCILLLLLFVCGWTGYVMVWDTFGQHLAREGARMIDTLPVLSEPTARAFTGEQPPPRVFFFLNLFAHIAIPLAMGVVFWLHLKRLARPGLLPPRTLLWVVTGALAAGAIVWPVEMAPRADPFVLPAEMPADPFFAFWVPVGRRLSAGGALLLAVVAGVALLVVPWVMKPPRARVPLPSVVDEDLCVGCVQCSIDCPYGAITMVERTSRRSDLVARVDPGLCVSCGICAGSCSPMGVGPPGRTGRDQMASVREFLASPDRRPGEVVVACCDHGAGRAEARAAGAAIFPVDCAGNLHTSIVELLIRSGAGGVLIVACPPRDCVHREGPRWLHERLYHGREAELQARVDRARVRVAHASAGERGVAMAAIRAFTADVARLGRSVERDDADVETGCEPKLAAGRR